MTKFITPDIKHPYILKLAEYLDIELEQSIEKVKLSDKALMLWNSYSYLKNPKMLWKRQLVDYFKENNKPYYILERGALPNTIMLDKNGFLCDSISYSEEAWNKELTLGQEAKIEQYISQFIKSADTLEPQSDRVTQEQFIKNLNLKPNRKRIFVPLQVSTDTVILLWSDWTKSLHHFQRTITDLALRNPDIDFLVKNHPIESVKTPSLIQGNLQNIKIVDKYHYKDCIEACDAVITVNSSVGLQALMWGKPVIVCGNAFFHNKNFTVRVVCNQELRFSVRNLVKPNMDYVKRFLYYLVYEFYTNCTMEKITNTSSRLTNVERLVYYTPENQLIIIENKNGN